MWFNMLKYFLNTHDHEFIRYVLIQVIKKNYNYLFKNMFNDTFYSIINNIFC